MFDVKVKTLDGRNTTFTVEDEITVAEFKEKISEQVDIPVDRQRLIFTGKVLTDANTLKSYNVADKVIHVVNRTPPSSSAAATTSAVSTTAPRAEAHRPSMSMSAVPSDMIGEVMNSVMSALPPGDTMVHHIDMRRQADPSRHTESGRRVVLIRQWIRDAHSLLDRTRHPAQGTRLTADSQTAEARIASHSIAHLPGESISVSVSTSNGAGPATAPRPAAPRPPAPRPPAPRSTSGSRAQATRTPQTPRPAGPTRTTSTSSSQSASGTTPAVNQSQGAVAGEPVPVNPHIEVLSSLWGEVDALNSRLHVHTHQYRELLDNPRAGCPGHSQHLFDTMSAVTHCLGHIYHALSDLNCDFSRPEASRELTATAAPAPPPTAIIQQTIPVTIPLTIPLRATVNASPRTSRRSQPAASTTSSVSSAAGSTTSTPTNQQTAESAAAQQQGIVTSIELDMATDSGEDIPEDGQNTSQGQPGAPQVPGLGGFNLSQIIQDAFTGMANMTGAGAVNTGTAAISSGAIRANAGPITSTPATAGQAASLASGSFGPFIPPAGAATPGNGPILAGPGVMPALPPGFPLPPGMGPSGQPKDRLDPYLTSCSSRHWAAPQPNRHTHSHSSQSSTVNRGARTAQSGTPRNASANQRHTAASTSARSGGTGAVRGGAIPSHRSASNTSASSLGMTTPPASDPQSEVLRRTFFEELSALVMNSTARQPWPGVGEIGATFNSPPELHSFTDRLLNIIGNASDGRTPCVSIAEVDRMVQDVLAMPDPPNLGLLGELCVMLFRDLTLTDLYHARMGHGQQFDRLRGPLRRFAMSSILEDGPHTPENMSAAVDRLMVAIREHVHQVLQESDTCRSIYDAESSYCTYIREWLLEILNFLVVSKEGTANYGQQLLDRLQQGLRNVMRLGYTLFAASSVRPHWDLSRNVVTGLIACCVEGRVLGDALRTYVSNCLGDPAFVETIQSMAHFPGMTQYLVRAAEEAPLDTTPVPSEQPARESPMHTDAPSTGSSDYQDAEPDTNHTPNQASSSAQGTPTVSPSPLSNVSLSDASAADWRAVIPADWVAIIEEDIKRQLRLEANPVDQPLSEPYINGRAQKRRKLSDCEDESQE